MSRVGCPAGTERPQSCRPPRSSLHAATHSTLFESFRSIQRSAVHSPRRAATNSATAASTTASRDGGINESVTDTYDDRGGVTRHRGRVATFRAQQVREGDDEQNDEEGQLAAAEAIDEQRQVQQTDGGQTANAQEEADSGSSLIRHTHSSAAVTKAVPYSEAQRLLPYDMLPSVDPAFMRESEALEGQNVADVAMSDMWQACGYHNLSDLMPDNIIRAFDTSMDDSQQAYDTLHEMERRKAARVAKYGVGQVPVVTVERVKAMAEGHLKRFRTHMDSRLRTSPHRHTHSLVLSASS